MPPGFRLSATLRAVFVLALGGIVYAFAAHLVAAEKPDTQRSPYDKQAQNVEAAKPAPKTSVPADAKRAAAARAEVRHGLDGLSPNVLEMRDALLAAVRSGRIEDLTTAIELNEIKPVFGDQAQPADPIAFLRAQSVDGDGRDVLAAIGNILDAPYAVVAAGRDIENNRIYVWPAFAETGVKDLTPAQDVELLRLVPPAMRKEMLAQGRYDFWSIGIGADGVWHFMRR